MSLEPVSGLSSKRNEIADKQFEIVSHKLFIHLVDMVNKSSCSELEKQVMRYEIKRTFGEIGEMYDIATAR